MTCDVPISTVGIDSAADIFTEPLLLGSSVVSEIPKPTAKKICFYKVVLMPTGMLWLLNKQLNNACIIYNSKRCTLKHCPGTQQKLKLTWKECLF